MAPHPYQEPLAHGLASLTSLPVPTGYVVVAAVAVLVVSFAVLAFAWRTPRFQDADAGWPLPEAMRRLIDSRLLRGLIVVLALAFAAWITMAAFFGPHTLANPALGTVYAVLWVGLVPAALLFGEIYRLCNPLRWIHRGLRRLAGVDPDFGVFEYPSWLGTWPAAAGLFAFTWLELVNPDWSADLAVVRLWFLGLGVIPVLAAGLFGEEAIARVDPFEVYSTLVARLSPFRRRNDGVLTLCNPLANLDATSPGPGLVAVVSVLFGSTVFDSFHSSVHFYGIARHFTSHLVLLNTLGLLTFCIAVAATFSLAAALTGSVGQLPRRQLPRQFAHSVLPIVVGYIIAHYFTFFVSVGLQTVQQLGDPLGRGWTLTHFMTHVNPFTIYYHSTAIWAVQVTAVVAGHVIAIIAAHNRAVALLPRAKAVVGQLPMLLLMIGYTMIGLTLLFSS